MSDSGDPKQDKDRELRAEREFYESMPNKPDQSIQERIESLLLAAIPVEIMLISDPDNDAVEVDTSRGVRNKLEDALLAMFDDMCREASCNDIAAGQPNDVHIGYFNKGFEAGVRRCRKAMPGKQEGEL